MIITTINETTNTKTTVSDAGLKIRKVGTSEVYDEAVDLITAPYEYEETDELVTPQEQEENNE